MYTTKDNIDCFIFSIELNASNSIVQLVNVFPHNVITFIRSNFKLRVDAIL